MMRLPAVLLALGLAASVAVACVPNRPLLSQPPEGGVGSNAPVRQGTLSVRLVDVRRGVQAIADAGSFNAVRFELRNPNKLVKPLVKGVSASGTTYEEVFTNLPSDPQDGYTLSVSLFNEVTSPADLADPGYANPDHLVGTGLSQPFSLQPGVNTTITVTINAVGELTFSSAVSTVDPSAPTLKPRDKTAKVLLGIDEHLNPDATELRYAVVNAAGATESVKTLERANWAALPTQTELPFTAPTATGSYHFVVDMLNGDELLSRRASAFDVALMPISSTPVKVVDFPEGITVKAALPNEQGSLYVLYSGHEIKRLEDDQVHVYANDSKYKILRVVRDHDGDFVAQLDGRILMSRAPKSGGAFGNLYLKLYPTAIPVGDPSGTYFAFSPKGSFVITGYINTPPKYIPGDSTNFKDIKSPDPSMVIRWHIAIDDEECIFLTDQKDQIYWGLPDSTKFELGLSKKWGADGKISAMACDDRGYMYYGVTPLNKVYRYHRRTNTHDVFAENVVPSQIHYDHVSGYLSILDDNKRVYLYR